MVPLNQLMILPAPSSDDDDDDDDDPRQCHLMLGRKHQHYSILHSCTALQKNIYITCCTVLYRM